MNDTQTVGVVLQVVFWIWVMVLAISVMRMKHESNLMWWFSALTLPVGTGAATAAIILALDEEY
jgi:hypothetical protein